MARRGDSRLRVLRAAARLFSRRGFAGTSIGDIAAKARASPSSIYWHFQGGKEAILLAVLDEAADSFVSRVIDAIERAPTLAAKVDAFFEQVQWEMEHSPDTLRLIQQMALERGAADAAVRSRLQNLFRRQRQIIADELARHLRQAGIESPEVGRRATLLVAVLYGVFLQWQLDPDAVDLDAVFGDLRADFLARAKA